ncbi:MAG: Asp-tRNA(Asn)/Glu-tRNA(Gln) amidotransferase subunit GatC [Methanoregula sp.]|jgi:aspartyl-tRNA(Asn)/glutamyl-tRNA(Gln) amidotransferase subunit C|nr:Asp-tRNA(Asn)/Glu-tRNA(Gln) amidotransferase subunit GatC [Methanoregula sp.]
MVSEKHVQHIAELADVGIDEAELGTFTHQFNAILEYFDILDRVEGDGQAARNLYNILREDEIEPSLPQEDVLRNAPAKEDGFIKAPRVM